MAKKTFGTTMRLGAAGGPLTAVSKLVEITPPKMSREALDATTHGSPGGAAEFIPDGVYDPGEIEVSMDYVAGDADDDLFLAAFFAESLYDFEWTANAAAGTETFAQSGVVISYGPDPLPVRGKQTATATIKLSGERTQAPSA